MRRLICTALLAAAAATPLVAAKTEATSWGKPGVTIDQYRTDAITCGRAGYYTDVSNTEAAHVVKDATGQLEANEADLGSTAYAPLPGEPPSETVRKQAALANIVARSGRIVANTRPTERMKDVGALMQGRVEDCLRGRGYVHFRLTPEQRKHLARLHLGSVERHIYLYQLATDPDVLRAQAM
jgi:hypothetical protein